MYVFTHKKAKSRWDKNGTKQKSSLSYSLKYFYTIDLGWPPEKKFL